MAVIDVAGFVADIKSQAIDSGFHVHDERHFVETYSLRQLWEVDLHPEEACSGPIDLHLSLDVDPRALLGFEDEVLKMDDMEADPPTGFTFPLLFTWTLPPLPRPPDLLVLATEIAGVGGRIKEIKHLVAARRDMELTVVGTLTGRAHNQQR